MTLLELLDDLFSIALRSSMYFYIPFRPNKLFETVLYPLQSILGIAGFSGDMYVHISASMDTATHYMYNVVNKVDIVTKFRGFSCIFIA